MAKYIDADKINAELMDEYHGMISDESMKIYKIMQMLDNASAADVQEVKHAKWVSNEGLYRTLVCSNCHRGFCCECAPYKYCCVCGAKMGLED